MHLCCLVGVYDIVSFVLLPLIIVIRKAFGDAIGRLNSQEQGVDHWLSVSIDSLTFIEIDSCKRRMAKCVGLSSSSHGY